VLLSVKFGALRGPDATWLGVDTRPAAMKNFLAYSLAPSPRFHAENSPGIRRTIDLAQKLRSSASRFGTAQS
jgi:hypothetical protein